LTALALAAWFARSRAIRVTIPRLRPPIGENAAGATAPTSRRREGSV
jgi:hypothetical protein